MLSALLHGCATEITKVRWETNKLQMLFREDRAGSVRVGEIGSTWKGRCVVRKILVHGWRSKCLDNG
jgi:hypothetical protein